MNLLHYFNFRVLEKKAKKDKKSKENSNGSVPLKRVDGEEEKYVVEYADGKKHSDVSFVRALRRTFGHTFLMAAFLKLLHDILVFVSPQILK